MNGKGRDGAVARVGWVSSGQFNGIPLAFLPPHPGLGERREKTSRLQHAGDLLSAENEAESSGSSW